MILDLSLPASYLLLFFTASFLGWCMEVICKLIQFGRFINRGFLIGPWCPIYGFGTVLITLLLSKFTDDPLAVFALAMLIPLAIGLLLLLYYRYRKRKWLLLAKSL